MSVSIDIVSVYVAINSEDVSSIEIFGPIGQETPIHDKHIVYLR